MATRTFNPVVTRRPAPGAARSSPRTTAPARTAGSPAGLPRFASTPAAKAPAINQRGDRWETEASRIAEAAVRQPAATPSARVTSTPPVNPVNPVPKNSPPSSRGNHPPAPRPPYVLPTPTVDGIDSAGTPLSPALRRQLEAVTGVGLGAVRVHTGPQAQQAADRVQARAFTVGSHIYLRSGESPHDTRLLAHETSHTIQQTATLNAARPRGPPQSGGHVHALTPAPSGLIQREPVSTTVPAEPEEEGLLEMGFWSVVERFVPQRIVDILREIRHVGIWEFLKGKLSSALDGIFAGMRDQGGFTAGLADIFEDLLARGRVILAALVDGDCEPLFAAVRDFRDTLSEIAGDAWDSITEFLQPIGDYLSGLWEKFGAPVVEFLGEFASDTWTFITELGDDLWNFTAPARDYASGIWTEIKNLLGFSEGEDDNAGGGLGDWIATKAGEVWDEITLALEPVIAPIREVADQVAAILPLEAIFNLRDTVTTWMDEAMQMADTMEEEGDIAEDQDLIRDIVLPGVRRAISGVNEKLTVASTWVTGLIGDLVGKVTGFVAAIGTNSLLSPLQGALQWLSDEATALGEWAEEKAVGVFDLAHEALDTLNTWIEPVLNALQRLIATVGNLMGNLGDFVLGPFMLIPECIREPIKNFLIENILGRIPVFAQLIAIPDLWTRAQTVFRRIVVQIFRDGNLAGAAWTFFREVIQLFGLPPELVTNLIRNAARAIGDILRDPGGFILNVFRAIGQGFVQFFNNFGRHLLTGIANWLFSALGDTGIRVPTEFSLRAVMDVVLQVLDITQERIFQAIERRVGPERAAQIRRGLGIATEVFALVRILVTEGPAGLWRELLSRLNNLWESIVNGVREYLINQVVAVVTRWIMSLLDVTGIMPVINAIVAVYNAIQSFVQYIRQMLEIVNNVFVGLGEIARGVLTRGANLVENNLVRLLPIAIGFMANQLGLRDLPQQIRRVVGQIRARVDQALDWIVDRIVRGIQAVVSAVRSGVAAVRRGIESIWDWLTARERFRGNDGEEHSIYVEGETENARIMVASTPAGITAAIGNITDPAQRTLAQAEERGLDQKLTDLKSLGVSAQAAGNRPGSTATTTTPAPNADRIRTLTTGMRAHMRALSTIFNNTLFAGASGSLPPARMTIPSAKAVSISADLTANRTRGSAPAASPPGWSLLEATGLTSGAEWVRLHLVNERFQGTGTSIGNLVPGTRRNNSNHLATVENPMKRLIGNDPNEAGKRGVVWYRATVSYYSSVPSGTWPAGVKSITLGNGQRLEQRVTDFAQSIHFTWGIWNQRPGITPAATPTWTDWQEAPSPMGDFVLEIPLPPFQAAHASALSSTSP